MFVLAGRCDPCIVKLDVRRDPHNSSTSHDLVFVLDNSDPCIVKMCAVSRARVFRTRTTPFQIRVKIADLVGLSVATGGRGASLLTPTTTISASMSHLFLNAFYVAAAIAVYRAIKYWRTVRLQGPPSPSFIFGHTKEISESVRRSFTSDGRSSTAPCTRFGGRWEADVWSFAIRGR